MINNLLNSKKKHLIASILISLALWIIVSFNPNNEITTVITDIPITIDLPTQAVNNSLAIFDGEDITASVEITGNRLTVGSVTKDDIIVYAEQTNTITSTGKYTLALSAKKSSIKSGFEISSLVSPSVINILVDRNASLEIEITDNINYTVPDGYYSSVSLSNSKITVEGPETELAKLGKVCVDLDIDYLLKTTKTYDNLPVKCYDKFDNLIESNSIKLSTDKVSATILVLLEKELDLKYDCQNTPSGIDINDYVISIAPEKILICGEESIINKTDSITLFGGDFSDFKSEIIQLELPVQLPTGCINLDNQITAYVKLDFTNMNYKEFYVNKFEVVGLPNGYKADVTTKTIKVRIYGKDAQLNALNSDMLIGKIDFSGQTPITGSISKPLKIVINQQDTTCWCYGDYTANVTISEI